MDCPRCGGRLERYELSDRVEVACDECGYVGVSVEHDSDRPEAESWAAVLERVEDLELGAAETGPAPPSVPESEGDPGPTTVRSDAPPEVPGEDRAADAGAETESGDAERPDPGDGRVDKETTDDEETPTGRTDETAERVEHERTETTDGEDGDATGEKRRDGREEAVAGPESGEDA